jgi:asparaginyl-tRNA synthetase
MLKHYKREHTRISEISSSLEGQEIIFSGWVRSTRLQAKIGFVVLYDGSPDTIQGITDSLETIESLRGVTIASFIKLKALVVKHPKKEGVVDLHIREIIKISRISDPIHYPLSGTPSLQYLRDYQDVRGHSETLGAVKRITSACAYLVSDFMQKHGVLKVFPPTMTGSDCEGAGETFTVTKLMSKNKSEIPVKVSVGADGSSIPSDEVDYTQDFFEIQASLTVSAQLHLEACLRGGGDVWCELPSYRAEPSVTSRHVASFTHQEAEFVDMPLEGLMDFLEEMTQFVFSSILSGNMTDLKLLEKLGDKKDLITKLQRFVSQPYARITYDEAINIIETPEHLKKLKKMYPTLVLPKWGDDLGSECEKYISEIVTQVPTLVHHYPASLKSFYMKQSDDKRTVESCDLLIPFLGELCGASVREDDYEKLMSVVTERKMDIRPIQWYVDLRKDGSVPTAGFGMGFERLICCITGMHIREVCQFIQAYKTLKY